MNTVRTRRDRGRASARLLRPLSAIAAFVAFAALSPEVAAAEAMAMVRNDINRRKGVRALEFVLPSGDVVRYERVGNDWRATKRVGAHWVPIEVN